jgi:hypothetical protein
VRPAAGPAAGHCCCAIGLSIRAPQKRCRYLQSYRRYGRWYAIPLQKRLAKFNELLAEEQKEPAAAALAGKSRETI